MNNKDDNRYSIIIMGATGAVGGATLRELLQSTIINKITLLGRRDIEDLNYGNIAQLRADIFKPSSYAKHVANHEIAICTLGVGEPSKINKEEFVKIDKIAVLDFAKVCKQSGVQHFQLLSSVGINHQSSNFFLKTKGELVEELKKLNFERLSIFQPSMIITPTNRYGFNQALVLTFWPIIDKLFWGGLKKFKGIKVEDLGKAIALNISMSGEGHEYLTWIDFKKIIQYGF